MKKNGRNLLSFLFLAGMLSGARPVDASQREGGKSKGLSLVEVIAKIENHSAEYWVKRLLVEAIYIQHRLMLRVDQFLKKSVLLKEAKQRLYLVSPSELTKQANKLKSISETPLEEDEFDAVAKCIKESQQKFLDYKNSINKKSSSLDQELLDVQIASLDHEVICSELSLFLSDEIVLTSQFIEALIENIGDEEVAVLFPILQECVDQANAVKDQLLLEYSLGEDARALRRRLSRVAEILMKKCDLELRLARYKANQQIINSLYERYYLQVLNALRLGEDKLLISKHGASSQKSGNLQQRFH